MIFENILIIKIRALGDTLLATPVCTALKQAYPQAKITMLVSPQAGPVLEDNPGVDEVRTFDKHMGLPAYWAFIRRLRQAHFDLVIALHASFRTALLARLSGCRKRVVHNHSSRNYFGTIPIKAPKEAKSTMERDLDAVRALGLTPDHPSMTLELTAKAEEESQDFLKQHHLDGKSFMLIAPGAGKPRKQWPPGQVIRFLQVAKEQSPIPWVLLAGPQEKDLATEVKKALDDRIPVFQGSLKAAAALIKQAKGMVTADSGPKHMACALGTRTLTLWTDEPLREWHPYDRKEHDVILSPTGIVADLEPRDVWDQAKRCFHQLGK